MQTEWKPDFEKIANKVVREILEDKTEEELQEAIAAYRGYHEILWEMAGRLTYEGVNLAEQKKANEMVSVQGSEEEISRLDPIQGRLF
jgi:hypothetical protein